MMFPLVANLVVTIPGSSFILCRKNPQMTKIVVMKFHVKKVLMKVLSDP